MKYMFVIILAILIVASIFTVSTLPERENALPIIYWVTDNNPARAEQINKFHLWQIDNGFGEKVEIKTMDELAAFRKLKFSTRIQAAIERGNKDGLKVWDEKTSANELPITIRVPKVEMRLDTDSSDKSKKIIQGVSGIAGDNMDMGTGAGDQIFFDQIGMLTDITEDAKTMTTPDGRPIPFDPSQTFPAIATEITVPTNEGGQKQVMFPCNVTASMIWVNLNAFEKAGVQPPSKRMTFEEFERLGKEFVEKANRGKPYRDVFFCDGVDIRIMQRSLGLSRFNETLTASRINDPRFVRVLELKKKWIDVDHLLPSQAERNAFSTQSGYGGSTMQLLNQGNFAMVNGWGRYALIQLRRFYHDRAQKGQPPLKLKVIEYPHGGFPNTSVGSRSNIVYAGGKNKELAKLFLAFLASESYNMQLVDDADALPPNPKYTKIEEYLRPKKYPSEWGIHEVFSNAMNTIGIGGVWSNFMPPERVAKIIGDAEDGVFSGMITPKDAAAEAEKQLNDEIRRTLKENPDLQEEYDRRLGVQAQIDERIQAFQEIERLKADGKAVPADVQAKAQKVPLEWIENIFYKRYYTDKGWAE